MFSRADLNSLDSRYFRIDVMNDYDVIVMSRNTGHFWQVHCYGNDGSGECVIFHKHEALHPYHKHGMATSLRGAIRQIKGHDVFQLKGRKKLVKNKNMGNAKAKNRKYKRFVAYCVRLHSA